MKRVLRDITKAALPAKRWTQLQSMRARNYEERWLRTIGILDLAKRFASANGSAVLHGPFEGMKYPEAAIADRNSVPKLLGSYECELHEVIDSALRSTYQAVIDIGSAEGYYAVGFAWRNGSRVVAFDTDPRELKLCREMARLNGVENLIETQSWCSAEALRILASGSRCFVLSDCEGYEVELFDQTTVASLGRCDVLIEIHGDTYEPLRERLSNTHAVQEIVSQERIVSHYPALACLAPEGARALGENRPSGQQWLFAKSLA